MLELDVIENSLCNSDRKKLVLSNSVVLIVLMIKLMFPWCSWKFFLIAVLVGQQTVTFRVDADHSVPSKKETNLSLSILKWYPSILKW